MDGGNDDGNGNELTDDDLNQLEDEAESEGERVEHLEPIVDEAKLESPISRWTNVMSVRRKLCFQLESVSDPSPLGTGSER